MLVLAIVLRFTVEALAADSLDHCARGAPLPVDGVVRLYGAPLDSPTIPLLRERPAVEGVDTFQVPEEAASYFVARARQRPDGSWRENPCWDAVTVGIPPTSVPMPAASWPADVKLYDLAGRLVLPPLRSGIYWRRQGAARVLVVLR